MAAIVDDRLGVHHSNRFVFPEHDDDAQRRQLAPELAALPRGDLLLGYQQRVHEARRKKGLLFVEKSRRIGLTWGLAAYSVLRAARQKRAGGRNQLYISYALDMTREFIDYCAMWAKAFGHAVDDAKEFLFEDTDPDDPAGDSKFIKAFRIDFASGFSIRALSSAPRSIRGKQGDVIIDEGAFVDNLEALIESALALKVWGGDVTVISSHFGAQNTFNTEIQKIRAGERMGRVLTITFDDAMADGLYERVCLVNGEEPTDEGKAAFRAEIYGEYGEGAAQELDCIPSKSAGAWLRFDQIEAAEDDSIPVVRWEGTDEFNKKPDHFRLPIVKAWCEEHLAPLLAKLDGRPIGVGDDFARSSDLSVIWLLRLLEDGRIETPFVVELRNVAYEDQLYIRMFILDALRLWRAFIDRQGNGGHTAERLGQHYGEARVSGIAARDEFFRDEGTPLKSRFESPGALTIPKDPLTSGDLRVVQVAGGSPVVPKKRTTEKGEDASKGAGKKKRHADAFVALIHAHAALRAGVVYVVEAITSGATGAPSGYSDDQLADPYAPLNFMGY